MCLISFPGYTGFLPGKYSLHPIPKTLQINRMRASDDPSLGMAGGFSALPPNTNNERREYEESQNPKIPSVDLCCLHGVPSFPLAAQAQIPVVKLIATGGTIAMKIDPVKNAPVPAITGKARFPPFRKSPRWLRWKSWNISNVPSGYMDPPRWIELQKAVVEALSRPEVAGVIVSHGTDTLEETAYFLDLTVASEKSIVLIGAQRNASEKDFDGPRNLYNAARICVSPDARGKGAMIVLNNQINAAREVTKTHTSDVETFKSGITDFWGPPTWTGSSSTGPPFGGSTSLSRWKNSPMWKSFPPTRWSPRHANSSRSRCRSEGAGHSSAGWGNGISPSMKRSKR